MDEVFGSTQDSKWSLCEGFSYASYPIGMHGRVPEIDVKQCPECENTEYCHSWQWVKHSGRPRTPKEAYVKGFHMQVTPLACMDVFLRPMWNGVQNAKILNIIVLDNRWSVWVDPELKKKPMEKASICKLPRRHAWVHSWDWHEMVSRMWKHWKSSFLTMSGAFGSIQGSKGSI